MWSNSGSFNIVLPHLLELNRLLNSCAVRTLTAFFRGNTYWPLWLILISVQDERGLRQLIDAGCYRAAINLTTRLLLQLTHSQMGTAAHHTPYSVRVSLFLIYSLSLAWHQLGKLSCSSVLDLSLGDNGYIHGLVWPLFRDWELPKFTAISATRGAMLCR